MKRKAIDDLIKWKENNNVPVLLTGAKGVGKTYLAYDFAKAFFEHIYYINFEREPLMKQLFTFNDSDRISELLGDHFNIECKEISGPSILILDEISFCEAALELLSRSDFKKNFDYIIAISSNPIPNDFNNNIHILSIFPLEFDEFLRAMGNEWYIELIQTHYKTNTKIPDIVHKELLELHQLYLQIGGMPGAVSEYLNFNSIVNVAEQHNLLMGAYHDYILKLNSDSDAIKMNQVFDSLVHQLMKDNKKFQYKLIRKGTTHSMYKEAITKLTKINYAIKCSRISNEELREPYKTFTSVRWLEQDTDINFKLYMQDIGLLNTKIAEEFPVLFNRGQRKAIIENYVAESLQAKKYPFAFWESESMAKIDFIIYKDKKLIPIEVFESDNTRSKSISVLKQKCDFDYAIKISTRNFEFSNQIKYVPFYAVFCM